MGMFKELETGILALAEKHGAAAVLTAAAQILQLKCSKCGKEWRPRGAGMPAQCPACKTTKWRA